MDEPLLSASHRFTRKSDHPFLSLISDSPRRGSRPRSPDLSSPSPLNPSSPPSLSRGTSSEILQSPSSSSSRSYEQESRYEPFLDSAMQSSRITANEVPDGASSYQGQRYQSAWNHQRPLLRIPEEEPVTRLSFSNLKAEQSKEGDAEAPWSPGERNGGHLYGTHSGNFGDYGAEDIEEEEKQRRTPSVTTLLNIAIPSIPFIPEILRGLSPYPDYDYMGSSPSPEETSHLQAKEAKDVFQSPEILSSLSDPYLLKEDHLQLDPEAVSLRDGIPKGDGLGLGRSSSLQEPPRRQPKKCVFRSKTAPLLSGLVKFQRHKESGKDLSKTQVQSASRVVLQASLGLCIYLAIGVFIYCWKKNEFSGLETVGVVDALYFCIVTMCTIGYGDITPVTPSAKILSCGLMFVGFGFIDALLSGMLTFVLDRQEHLLLTVVEDGHHERARNYVMDSKKGRMRIRMKVALAVATVMMTIIVGVVFLRFMEELDWVNAFYVTCISITTVGYGDYSFQTMWGRLFAAFWLLLSTLGVARAFLFLAEARVHRRHRRLAKKILKRKVTAGDLSTIDLDNDGHISKSEFVVYKLKEMGRVQQGEILEVCRQFDVLDNMNAGKITLGQLLDADR